MSDIVTTNSNALVPTNISDAMRLAEFMSRARTLPKHLWDSPGDCLMVVELAMRWGMSPFAVAQGISIIQGKQMIEGKLIAAAVESSGAIAGHFDYDFAGEDDDRTITVSATRRGETNPRTVEVVLKNARTANEMWKRQPDQQLVYHGTRVWARRWTPAVILGVYSREEMGHVIEGGIVSDEGRVVSDETEAPSPPPNSLRAVAATVTQERKVAPKAPRVAARTDEQWRVWVDKLNAACKVLYRRSEVVEVGNRPSVGEALATGPQWVKDEISAILHENYTRFPEEPDAETPDDLEIPGEKYAAAG